MSVITVTPLLTIRHHIGAKGKDGITMRGFLLVVALLFPLMSGIVSVMMAGPVIYEPSAYMAHHPEMTFLAARPDQQPR